MFKYKIITGVTIFILSLTQGLFAQYTAEVFIPLGQSPGLSGKHTMLGTINAVNIQNNTLSIGNSSGLTNLKVSAGTQIWLDQSQLKLNNRKTSIQQLKKGMQAEVKFIKNEKNGAVEWIKVRHAE